MTQDQAAQLIALAQAQYTQDYSGEWRFQALYEGQQFEIHVLKAICFAVVIVGIVALSLLAPRKTRE